MLLWIWFDILLALVKWLVFFKHQILGGTCCKALWHDKFSFFQCSLWHDIQSLFCSHGGTIKTCVRQECSTLWRSWPVTIPGFSVWQNYDKSQNILRMYPGCHKFFFMQLHLNNCHCFIFLLAFCGLTLTVPLECISCELQKTWQKLSLKLRMTNLVA